MVKVIAIALFATGCAVTPKVPMPHKPLFKVLSPVSVASEQGDPTFTYPSNACGLNWMLQGSSNLVDWVDLLACSTNCPSGTMDAWITNQVYFYRMKGTP